MRCLAFLSEDLVAAGGAAGGVILLRRSEGGAWEHRQALHGDADAARLHSHGRLLAGGACWLPMLILSHALCTRRADATCCISRRSLVIQV